MGARRLSGLKRSHYFVVALRVGVVDASETVGRITPTRGVDRVYATIADSTAPGPCRSSKFTLAGHHGSDGGRHGRDIVIESLCCFEWRHQSWMLQISRATGATFTAAALDQPASGARPASVPS